MTIMEDLLIQIVGNTAKTVAEQVSTLALLKNWGTPMSKHNGPRPRARVQLVFGDEKSRTQQSFKEETDINNIMRKFRKTGELTHLAKNNPQYGNFDTGLDYKEANDRVLAAQSDFDNLSAAIRQRMDNDPMKLLLFMENPDNEEEARELGLINPEEPPAEPVLVTMGGTASGGDPPPIPPQPSPIAGGE